MAFLAAWRDAPVWCSSGCLGIKTSTSQNPAKISTSTTWSHQSSTKSKTAGRELVLLQIPFPASNVPPPTPVNTCQTGRPAHHELKLASPCSALRPQEPYPVHLDLELYHMPARHPSSAYSSFLCKSLAHFCAFVSLQLKLETQRGSYTCKSVSSGTCFQNCYTSPWPCRHSAIENALQDHARRVKVMWLVQTRNLLRKACLPLLIMFLGC